MTANRRTARRIPGVQSETEVALNRIIDQLSARLEALEAKPVDPQTQVADFLASERQTLTLEAPPAGINGTLVQATRFNKGQRITFFQRNANPVRFRAINGTVNGVPLVISNARGTYDAVSDGAGGWALNQNITSTGVIGLPGTPGTIGPMGFSGQDGEQGERGDQGFPGATGATGATGPTGPSGSGSFSLPPFCIASDNADEPTEYIPRGWANALASNPRSGGNNAFWDVGQFANFGLAGPLTSAPQITCGDATFRIRGGGNVAIFADGGIAQLSGSTQINLVTGVTGRLAIDSTGAWSLAGIAGAAGQVPTSAGPGADMVWSTPSAGSAMPPALMTSVPDNVEEPSFIPRPGWAAALASNPRSGAADPTLDADRLLRFDTTTATDSAQLSSGTRGAGSANLLFSRRGAASGGIELVASASGPANVNGGVNSGNFWVELESGGRTRARFDDGDSVSSHRTYYLDCTAVQRLVAVTSATNSAGTINCTGTFAIPGLTLVAGSRWRVVWTYQFLRGATATNLNLVSTLTVGVTTLAVTSCTTASTTNGFVGFVRVEAEFTMLTTGAGGTAFAFISSTANCLAANATLWIANNANPFAVSTTGSLNVFGSASMSVAVPGTTINSCGGHIERVF